MGNRGMPVRWRRPSVQGDEWLYRLRMNGGRFALLVSCTRNAVKPCTIVSSPQAALRRVLFRTPQPARPGRQFQRVLPLFPFVNSGFGQNDVSVMGILPEW